MGKCERENYSVLMSVYRKETPAFLRASMESMFAQTAPTDDFVLICDGTLTEELDAVITEMDRAHPNILHVVRFPENHGLGHALQVGVKECKNELIARMDSDDISRPERCEKELAVMTQHPEYSIVGGLIEEFSTTPDVIDAVRIVPETQDKILAFAKVRNPFNHVTVMLRKKDVLQVGNYSDVRYIQDYYLWVDMFAAGMCGYNIQEPLVWVRADTSMIKRRGGKLYVQIQVDLFKKMRDCGMITQGQYLKSAAIRICSASAPAWMRKFMFDKVLRKH